jgi:hypothetical protein
MPCRAGCTVARAGTPEYGLSVFKNRAEVPPPINPRITVRKNSREARYGNSEGPAVVGYVALVKSGDAESCNCGATDAAHVDTQIALVTDLASANDKSKHIVVEVTPRTRGRYHFPSTATLKKQYYTSA